MKNINPSYLYLKPTLMVTFFLILCGCQKADSSKEETASTSIAFEETATDAEGNTYPLVKIGTQVWMAENLRLTKTNCPDAIEMQFTNGIERGPGVTFYDGKERYAYYNNNPSLGYGVIYSYGAVFQCDLCPTGFRIPSKADFEQLVANFDNPIEAGKALLSSGESGFNANPVGRIDDYGSVLGGQIGFWWTTDIEDHPENRNHIYNFELSAKGVLKIKTQDPRVGNYVRCIKE